MGATTVFGATAAEVFSGDGAIGDLYYLSPRFTTIAKPTLNYMGGENYQNRAVLDSKTKQSFSDMLNSINKNNFAGAGSLSIKEYVASTAGASFQALPSFEQIDFSGMASTQAKAVYSSLQTNY
ncbi:MAG: hypothetical protein PF437_09310, partial [Sulfurimonas sp.]|nr:hypothetical protein [Sulfurimonas sp.]